MEGAMKKSICMVVVLCFAMAVPLFFERHLVAPGF
jgi:hypothetical protein